MKRTAFALTGWLLAAGSSMAQAPEKPRGYDAFQLTRSRPIFDPSRQAREPRSQGPRREGPTRSRPNFLMLTGTMVTEGKSLAFFSGGGGDGGKVAPVGETVSDFKIVAITAQNVQLEKAGKAITLVVGKQLTLEGTVAVPAGLENTAETAATPDAATPPAAPDGTDAPAAGGTNDVLKKMMERRQKEMTK